jgi:hypothetical protein
MLSLEAFLKSLFLFLLFGRDGSQVSENSREMKWILCLSHLDLQARDAGSRFVSILPTDEGGGGVEQFIRGGVEQLFILLQRSRREHYNLISLQGREGALNTTWVYSIFS